jgi:hypothetical protein
MSGSLKHSALEFFWSVVVSNVKRLMIATAAATSPGQRHVRASD